ncbi:hypothetical protein QN326_05220 [Candidatus Phytoplasma asteris]|uniref:Uncharacterized protein n=1 Tax=Candidatus Phytoplasma asteris TaxID=85620 RepID=A0ABZ3CF69_9MOLU
MVGIWLFLKSFSFDFFILLFYNLKLYFYSKSKINLFCNLFMNYYFSLEKISLLSKIIQFFLIISKKEW